MSKAIGVLQRRGRSAAPGLSKDRITKVFITFKSPLYHCIMIILICESL